MQMGNRSPPRSYFDSGYCLLNTIRAVLNRLLKSTTNFHVSGKKPDIFLISTPRSGSTWLMEMILAEGKVRPCNEPLNLRKKDVANKLGIHDWAELASESSMRQISRYLDNISKGRMTHSHRNLTPFMRGYSAITSRVLFKVLFGLEDRIKWLKEERGALVIGLVRHPIPVSLSREETPRLQTLLSQIPASERSHSVQKLIENVMRNDLPLEKKMLDWSLQNKPIIEASSQFDLLLTYEQLVLQPATLVDELADTLGLDARKKIANAAPNPSRSVSKSSPDNQKLLGDDAKDRWPILNKWREKVDAASEAGLMQIPLELGLDIYETENPLPAPRYWIGNDYPGRN